MNTDFIIRVGFYVCAAVAVIFIVEAVFMALSRPISHKRGVNRRLREIDGGLAGEQALIKLKAERGILDKNLEVIGWFSRLLVQSGLRMTAGRFAAFLTLAFLVVFLGSRLLTTQPLWVCAAAATVVGLALPLQVVRFIRSKRQAKFTEQLPEALDVVVRSLRSGHPVPTAMGLVGKEMADPIRTEFGITIDEMTYGSSMTDALANLADRVGVPDLSLLVTAVSLQSSSGGNLSEVLENLSKVLRDRFQLRRKVRSISAEGRYSAYGLTVLPALIFLAIFVQNPSYYTSVWGDPVYKMTMGGLVVWSLVGDYMMFKMINFKF